jgi:hypothetical protein
MGQARNPREVGERWEVVKRKKSPKLVGSPLVFRMMLGRGYDVRQGSRLLAQRIGGRS